LSTSTGDISRPNRDWQFSLATLIALLSIAALVLGGVLWTLRFFSLPYSYFGGFLGFICIEHFPAWISVVGIAISIKRWRRHPITSRRALVGFSVLVFYHAFAIILGFWLLHAADPLNFDRLTNDQINAVSITMKIVRVAAYLFGFLLLFLAIFGDRGAVKDC
jgi:hypothetical protein